MAEVPSYMCTKFYIFAPKPRKVAVEGTTETIYKPIASIDQLDIEFLIPGDSETYIDLDLKLYIKGKLTKEIIHSWETLITQQELTIFYTLSSVNAALF